MTRLLLLMAIVTLSACSPQRNADENVSNAVSIEAPTENEPDVINIEAAAVQRSLDERSSQAGVSSGADEKEFSAPFPGKYGTTNGMWAFGKVTDRMRNETITEAYAVSKSLGNDELLIRFQRKDGVTFRATLEPQRPYYFAVCGEACNIPVSIDGKMHELVARNGNAGATVLEAFDPQGFERLLKNSHKMMIELELDDGKRQYEFRTNGLDWSAAEGADPMFSS